MLITGIFCYCVSYLIYLFGALRASRQIHKTLVGSVLSATLRYVSIFTNFCFCLLIPSQVAR